MVAQDLTSEVTSKYYTLKDLDRILFKYNKAKTRKYKGVEYYNIPIAFDIEVSSFIKRRNKVDEKVAIMYIWQVAIDNKVIIGRTWSEFHELLDKLVQAFGLNEDKHLVIYVHNLSYEFQFIKDRLLWAKVFALHKRKPIQAITTDGIEFRCSYLLSGYPLSKLSNQLLKHEIKKLTGNLDYDKIRHSKTPLTEEEIQYCINDVLVVTAYISETIDRCGHISKIPLTKTGFVRNYCRNECFYSKEDKYRNKYKAYKNLMDSLILDSNSYEQLKKAFTGGFTHCNAMYSMETINDVYSFDFTSSYPYVMCSEEFPMSAPERIENINREVFIESVKYYCSVFECTFTKIKSKVFYENYIGKSHCYKMSNICENNGRIVSADKLTITLTNVDFLIVKEFYSWENVEIKNLTRYRKGYLPKDFVLSILKLYNDKTTLKGVKGKELEYAISKENVNSAYGMTVTDICRPNISYINEWQSETGDIDELVEKNNKSRRRFLYYPWGVWVTAYARKNLFTGIREFKDDYIYSDTDSIKVINYENHKEYIEQYNNMAIKKLKTAMDRQGIDFELTRPKNIKGEVKQLGIWNYEGKYDRFKTLGAKRYLVEQNGKYELTVAGLGKNAINYMVEHFEDVFEGFNNELYIPPEHTSKNIHTYIDEEKTGYVTDYLGNKYHYKELSATHLMKADFTMNILDTYIDYLLDIKNEIN